MIRYMGGKGQSSDPAALAYDPQGLPLEPGLIEVVTPESSAPGQRHEALADHVGEIAVRTWRGFPKDPKTETSGVGWILAVNWVPYQRSTFVTPAFAAYVSGHSTFSRAAAEVMTAVTGSAYFPGGIFEWTVQPGELLHEKGPAKTSPSSGRRTSMPLTRPACPGCTWASTSRRTISRAAGSGRRAAWRRGRSPSATSTARARS